MRQCVLNLQPTRSRDLFLSRRIFLQQARRELCLDWSAFSSSSVLSFVENFLKASSARLALACCQSFLSTCLSVFSAGDSSITRRTWAGSYQAQYSRSELITSDPAFAVRSQTPGACCSS